MKKFYEIVGKTQDWCLADLPDGAPARPEYKVFPDKHGVMCYWDAAKYRRGMDTTWLVSIAKTPVREAAEMPKIETQINWNNVYEDGETIAVIQDYCGLNGTVHVYDKGKKIKRGINEKFPRWQRTTIIPQYSSYWLAQAKKEAAAHGFVLRVTGELGDYDPNRSDGTIYLERA